MPPSEGNQAERLLLDTIDRLRRHGTGAGQAVHLHLSRLLPSNRQPVRMRIVARMFKGLETGYGANVYRLSNDDLVILGRDLPEDEIDLIVHRVRSLFEHDPVTYAGRGRDDPDDPLVTWYDLLVDHRRLVAAVEAIEQERLRKLGTVGAGGMTSPFTWADTASARPEPVEPRSLDRVLDDFETFELLPHLRRQPAVRITDKRTAEIAFEEFFVSIGSLQKQLCPQTVLTGDRWLFQEFSRALDRRVLEALAALPVLRKPSVVSLNLNLESTRTKAFRRLVGALEGRQKLVVEVQVIDVFADIAGFEDARDTLRKAGHAVVIDGLSPVTLRLLDVRKLDPDYAKVLWNADLATEETADKTAAFAAEVKTIGPKRVVLARCETEAAVLWGLANGIRLFQGRFIDAILGTVTMASCPASASCTLVQCVGRRAAMDGVSRGPCPHPPGLDAVQTFAAPGAAAGKAAGKRAV